MNQLTVQNHDTRDTAMDMSMTTQFEVARGSLRPPL